MFLKVRNVRAGNDHTANRGKYRRLRGRSQWCALVSTLALVCSTGTTAAPVLTDPTVELVVAGAGSGLANAVLSADGRYVAFASYDANLVSEDTNSARDVFVRDRRTGIVSRISVGTGGTEANGGSDGASISADGRFVTFVTEARNLGGGNGADMTRIYLHDRVTARTTYVADGYSAVLSGNGRVVAYLTVPDSPHGDFFRVDAFVREITAGRTERVSVGTNGMEPDGNSYAIAISNDGRVVAFASSASNLVDGDTNGNRDVFVRDRAAQTTRRVNVSPEGVEDNGGVKDYGYGSKISLSGDGQIVVFESTGSNLVPGDTNHTTDVFAHDLRTAITSRASVDSFGGQAQGGSEGGVVSADGRYVAFTSNAPNLVAGSRGSAYFHDRRTGLTEQIDLDAEGRQPRSGGSVSFISAGGRYVIFDTQAALVAHDTNTDVDEYIRDRGTRTTSHRLAELGEFLGQVSAPSPLLDVLRAATATAAAKETAGDRAGACRSIVSFIQEVQARWNGDLTSADAGRLFAEGEGIERGLGCRTRPNNSFRFTRSSVPLPRRSAAGALETGDLNGDGAVDALVRLHGQTDGWFALIGDGLGSFPKRVALPISREWTDSSHLWDVDADGRLDIVVVHRDQARVSIMLSRGTGRDPRFATTELPLPAGFNSIAAGDVTGDGLLDLVSVNYESEYLLVFAALGGGRFADPLSVWSGAYGTGVAVTDLDVDGYADVLIGRYNGLAVMPGSSGGPLSGYRPIVDGSWESFSLVDLNADRRADVIVRERLRTRILLNTSGGFSEVTVVEHPENASAAWGDYNADGRLDLVLSDYFETSVVVYRGNGDGTFGVRESFAVGNGVSTMRTADVNQDGTEDLLIPQVTATGSEGEVVSGAITVLLNRPRVFIETWNDHQRFALGTTRTIAWRHALGSGASFRVDISRNGGRSWSTLQDAVAAPGGRGRFSWTVTGPTTVEGRIRVVAVGDPTAVDVNNALFEIGRGTVRFTTVGNDQEWGIGSQRLLGWSHNLGTTERVHVDFSRDDGATWTLIAADLPLRGAFTSTLLWTVTGPASARARVRVRWADDDSVANVSPPFRIVPPFLRLTWPISGSVVYGCNHFTPTWVHNLGLIDEVILDLSLDGAKTWEMFWRGPSTGLYRGSFTEHEFTRPGTKQAFLRVTWAKSSTLSHVIGPFTITEGYFYPYCD